LVGAVDGRAVRVGSARWVAPRGLQQEADDMAAQGMSIVVLAVDEQVAGVIGVRDELRPEASEAVSMLRERGIEVLMLTGDNRRTAGALANEAGICDVRAAIPTVAAASAGASLMPSPIIAVGVRLAREATSSALSAGSCS
ncbi:MAG: heavy metal translocating P-type ATPase, partial [Nocardioides sp.]|nr:heavy metal translocating P-type ATPase [Nocardioides sp.]